MASTATLGRESSHRVEGVCYTAVLMIYVEFSYAGSDSLGSRERIAVIIIEIFALLVGDGRGDAEIVNIRYILLTV